MVDNRQFQVEFYEQHARRCDPTDFWGQVKRTVRGSPVSSEQIQLIVDSVRDGLQINGDDYLLDLCCGNGALTSRIFSHCRGGLGVDITPYLIQVATENFIHRPTESFACSDIQKYLLRDNDFQLFTKAMWYGAFQCFEDGDGMSILQILREKYPAISHIYVGNQPDKDRHLAFYGSDFNSPELLKSTMSPLGIWRTPREFANLAKAAGWRTHIHYMSDNFVGAHYRFDAILSRF